MFVPNLSFPNHSSFQYDRRELHQLSYILHTFLPQIVKKSLWAISEKKDICSSVPYCMSLNVFHLLGEERDDKFDR